MVTQLADCGPHLGLQSAKFGPPHFLEVALGTSRWGVIRISCRFFFLKVCESCISTLALSPFFRSKPFPKSNPNE